MDESEAASTQDWMIDGVTAAGRDAAEQAALAAGLTIGEWLGRAIRSARDEASAAARPAAAGSETRDHRKQPAEGFVTLALRRRIVERIRHTESATLGVMLSLHKIVEQLSSRIDKSDAPLAGVTGDSATPGNTEPGQPATLGKQL